MDVHSSLLDTNMFHHVCPYRGLFRKKQDGRCPTQTNRSRHPDAFGFKIIGVIGIERKSGEKGGVRAGIRKAFEEESGERDDDAVQGYLESIRVCAVKSYRNW